MANKLYKFRENITFKTTRGFNDIVVGSWKYVYTDKSIPEIRMKASKETYSFEEARNVCYTWPDCVAGKSIFKKPYIRVWDTWGGRVYYKEDIEEITYFMEYAELERGTSMRDLYENLPASHFIEYCKDNAFPIKVEVE